MRRDTPRPQTAEEQRAREEFDAFVAAITPPGYDPTFDKEAVQDVGHLDVACDDVLELAAKWSAAEFAERYHARRTIRDVLPKVAAAVTYLTAVHHHLEERSARRTTPGHRAAGDRDDES